MSGEEVSSGRIGKIPVAQTERISIGYADYRLPWLPPASVDMTPARYVIDLGARHRFQIGNAPTTVRFFFGNIFDRFGWRTGPSEVFVVNPPRRFSITIAADFVGGR